MSNIFMSFPSYKLHAGSFVVVNYYNFYEIWMWMEFILNSKQ